MENNIVNINTNINLSSESLYERLYLVFIVANKQYAISSNNIIELMNLPQIDFITKTPHAIAGLLNYKGERIKVIDFRIILGEKLQPFTVENQIIILEHKEQIFAFLIDKIVDVYSIKENQIQNLPYKQGSSIIKNIFQINEKMVSIVDLNAVEQYLDFTVSSIGETDYEKLFPSDEHSKNILEKRSGTLAKQNEILYDINTQKHEQYLFFKLANMHYCINIKFIKEIITKNHVKISTLPNTPHFIRGITNLRGEFITIIDLSYLLNKKSSIESSSQKLIVINSEEYKIAFIVDDILYINSIEGSKIYFHDGRTGNKHIHAEFYKDDKLYNILNVEKILMDKQLLINIS